MGMGLKERKCPGLKRGGKWRLDPNPFINPSHPQLVSKIPGIALLFSMHPLVGPFVNPFPPLRLPLTFLETETQALLRSMQTPTVRVNSMSPSLLQSVPDPY